MSCYYHPDQHAVNTCSACSQPICAQCNYVTGTHPLCRHCWESRISNAKAGKQTKPPETRKPHPEKQAKPQKQKQAAADIPAAFTFVSPEPSKPGRTRWEPPAQKTVQETVIPDEPRIPGIEPKQAEPMKHFETPLQQMPMALPEAMPHKEQAEKEPAPQVELAAGFLQVPPPELATPVHQSLPPASEVTHIELPPIPHTPEPGHIEPIPPTFVAPQEQPPTYQEPIAKAEKKPKPGRGTRALSVFGSLSKLRLNLGSKGKQQIGPHYIQVAHQTFQCHQCGSENFIGELFCQTCGSWFQYSCPSCNAVVDPGFDSCPNCFTELGWGHTAEEEYDDYP